MTFGEKLYDLRTTSKLSQDALAEALDVSRQAVSKWERDEAMPDIANVLKISEIFSVSTDYLLKDSLTENPAEAKNKPTGWEKLGQFIYEKKHWFGLIPIILGLRYSISIIAALFSIAQYMKQLKLGGFFDNPDTPMSMMASVILSNAISPIFILILSIAAIIVGVIIIYRGVKKR